MLKSLALALLATLVFSAEEAKEVKPNPAIEKAIAPALAEASKGYEAYQNALAKATDKAVKELDKLKVEAMKKGDLPLAVAVDAQIKAFKEGALGDRVAEKAKDAEDLLSNKAEPSKPDSKSPIIGKWQRVDENGKESNEKTYKCTWEFNKDGSGLCNGSKKIHWKLTEPNTYHITTDPGQSAAFMAGPDVDFTTIDDGKEIVASYGSHYRKADDKSIKPTKENK